MTTQDVDSPKTLVDGAMDYSAPQKISWPVPIALFACVLLAFFDKISIAALFSDHAFLEAQGIGSNTALSGLLMSAFLVAYGLSSLFISGIGDRINPVKVLLGMMLSWSVLMALMGLCHSWQAMIVLRILLGISEGPLVAISYTIIRQTFPAHLQARANMMWLLGTPLGAALGFPATLYILGHFGWQATFYFMTLLTLPVMLLVLYGMRQYLTQSAANGSRPARPKSSSQERKSHRSELYKNPSFWLICLFNIAFMTYLWGMNGWLPSYLIDGKNIHLSDAGYLSSLPFIAMLLGEILGALLSDKLDRRAGICLVALLGAAAGLVWVMQVSSPLLVISAMSFSTFMWGAASPNLIALLAKVTRAEVSATAGGIFNGIGNFAGALAPVVMGALIALTHNMDYGLMFLVAISAVGAFILLPIVKRY
ncbi:MFS transporter [Salmonella enterica subsp. enterica serovar Choleraesuis]|nr:MFS transporter [Salmonella enterica subsp. enterica serovar Choleraesuis]